MTLWAGCLERRSKTKCRADHAIERGEVRGGGGALDAVQHLLGVDAGQPIERAVEMHGARSISAATSGWLRA